ncbi:MAG: tetratricopeptide repeat protein [Deltaproteobacteria bacterium]|nr:tetratricopeptide repeat protein [Deltaproteobacteria bacterium]
MPGYYSRVVQSRKNWRTQLTHFERLIKDYPARVINATEGGARIEGAEQLSLAEVIERYCTQPCGSSGLENPLITDPQGDSLIDEVLPLIKNEAEIMRAVIHHTRPALATNQKMRRLVEKGSQEATATKRYRRLAKENDRHTLATQRAAERIPILVEAIFGAYKSALGLVPDDEMDAEARLDLGLTKNKTMLSSTRKAALHLIEAYEKTIDILDRYVTCRDALKKPQTDSDLLAEMAVILEEMGFAAEAGLNLRNALELTPEEPVYWEALGRLALKREKFKEVGECCERLERLPGEEEAARRLRQDLDVVLGGLLAETEDDFLEGNFAFPLLSARKYLGVRPDEAEVKEILNRAVRRRDEKIAQAETQAREFKKAMAGELGRQKRYVELLEQSKTAGREEKDFEASLKLLQEAAELIPELPEARWGLATTLHHLGRTEESLEAFQELVEVSPDNARYRFEMGMVMLDLGRTREGLAQIAQAMDQNNQFDSFLPRMAICYRGLKLHDEALSAYDKYLKSFQADFEAWTQRGDCLAEMGKLSDALGSYEQALVFRPDFELALAHKNKVEMVTNGGGANRPN